MTESKNPYRSVKRQKSTDDAEQYELPRWLYEKDGTLDKELAAEFNAKRGTFIEKIRAIFPADQHPGNDKIGRGYSEDYIIDPEFLPTFKSKTWEEISLETAKKYSYDFFYKFDTPGQLYFLPLFLICLLRYPGEMDGVWLHLLPYTPGNWWGWVSDLMNDNQKQMMIEFCRFVEFMGYEGEDIDANIRFWQRMLKAK